jgi:hypothetical protein
MKNFINCPKCDAKLALSFLIQEGEEGRTPPKDGDYNICFHCHTLSIFEKDETSLRLATEEENNEFLKQFDKS